MDGINETGKATLLVVDDTPDNLVLMSNLLKEDYKVKVANSGEKALKIAASSSPPDLILLDIMMPGMDGYEVCRRLKRDPKTMNIPVIFLTAKTEVEDEKMGLELGAIDYITKPISPPIVMARVKNHVTLKAMIDFLRDQNDWDSAARLAYTLKGISGNIGVTGLQEFAEKLDVAIKARRPREEINLENLIAQLDNKTPPDEQVNIAATVDQQELKTVCDQLEALLADDNSEAGDVLDANAKLLNAAFPNHYRKINYSIRSFDFEAALATLRVASGTFR